MGVQILPPKPIYTDEEIWLPAVRWGIVIPHHEISHHGRLLNTRTGKIRKEEARIHNTGMGYKDVKYVIQIDPELFKDVHGYIYENGNMSVAAHRLVMETFKPLRLHYREFDFPESVIAIFDKWTSFLTQNEQEYAFSHFVVDHIDSNVRNNHLSNLQWCSSADNQAHRKAKKMGYPVNAHGVRPEQAHFYKHQLRMKEPEENLEGFLV